MQSKNVESTTTSKVNQSNLRNIAELAIHRGDTEEAIKAGVEAHEAALATRDRIWIRRSHTLLASANDLAGATKPADEHFIAADLLEVADDPGGEHLFSILGTSWAAQLARTGRISIARCLTERNSEICKSYGWGADSARCNRELGRCDLIEGDLDSAGTRLLAATEALQDGEYLAEWAATLPLLAEHRRRTEELDEAERICTTAIDNAGPRGLVPTHAQALAVRAVVRGDRYAVTGDRDQLARARDDADHALRLATRSCRLPWQELDALDALAYVGRKDLGWRIKADELRAKLVPSGLDPNPLATVQARVRRTRSPYQQWMAG